MVNVTRDELQKTNAMRHAYTCLSTLIIRNFIQGYLYIIKGDIDVF